MGSVNLLERHILLGKRNKTCLLDLDFRKQIAYDYKAIEIKWFCWAQETMSGIISAAMKPNNGLPEQIPNITYPFKS